MGRTSDRVIGAAVLVASVALHGWGLSLLSRPEAGFSGDGGEALATLEPASDDFAEMVARFDGAAMPAPTPFDITPPESRAPEPEVEAEPDPAPEPEVEIEAPVPDIPEAAPVPVPVKPAPPKPTKPKRAKPKPAKPKPAKPAVAKARTSKTNAAGQPTGGPSTGGQRAAGRGGGTRAGDGGAVRAAQEKDLRRSWGVAIRARIDRRKSYPPAAGRAKGTVTLRLTVGRGGQLAAVSVARSSGNPALDQAALAAVRRAAPFPAAPAGLGKSSYNFVLPINFAR